MIGPKGGFRAQAVAVTLKKNLHDLLLAITQDFIFPFVVLLIQRKKNEKKTENILSPL